MNFYLLFTGWCDSAYGKFKVESGVYYLAAVLSVGFVLGLWKMMESQWSEPR